MARQRLKSVQLPCSHFILVPCYQSSKSADYTHIECTHAKCVEKRQVKGKK